MRLIGVPLSPGRGRMPKSEIKAERRRQQVAAATEYKKALLRRDGLHRKPSPVRRIDPKTGEVINSDIKG
jgi:hypothetical protein